MTCCQCQGAESVFGDRYVNRELRSYRRKGPRETTALMLRVIKEQGVSGATVLDIGGGIGTIQHELLRAGASRAMCAEASTAYLQAAEEEARRQGLAERIENYHGDFVDIADSIEPADIVTLDRVICCYPDMESLVRLSTAKARRVWAVVYPRDILLTRVGSSVLNLGLWVTRNPFRVYKHATDDINALVFQSGFRQVFARNTLTWQISVFSRRSNARPR